MRNKTKLLLISFDDNLGVFLKSMSDNLNVFLPLPIKFKNRDTVGIFFILYFFVFSIFQNETDFCVFNQLWEVAPNKVVLQNKGIFN